MNNILIRNCDFKFKCTQRWESLRRTENNSQRFCKECDQNIHLCISDDELYRAMKLDQCVAIPVEICSTETDDLGSLFLTGVPIIR